VSCSFHVLKNNNNHPKNPLCREWAHGPYSECVLGTKRVRFKNPESFKQIHSYENNTSRCKPCNYFYFFVTRVPIGADNSRRTTKRTACTTRPFEIASKSGPSFVSARSFPRSSGPSPSVEYDHVVRAFRCTGPMTDSGNCSVSFRPLHEPISARVIYAPHRHNHNRRYYHSFRPRPRFTDVLYAFQY